MTSTAQERDYAAIGRQGGVASGVAKRRAILANAERVDLVDTLVDGLTDEDIGTNLLSSAVKLVNAAASGEIPVPETPLERKQLADAAKVVHYMARLQLGESTSNVATRSVEDARAERARLEERMRALAAEADDPASPSPTRDVDA